MKFRNNFIGYFRFYYSLTGRKLLVNFLLSLSVSLLDGIGLAMFMPLLAATGNQSSNSKQTLGNLHYVTDFIEKLGFSLTINTVLTVLVLLFVVKGILKFIQMIYQVQTRLVFMKRIRTLLINDLQDLSYQAFLKLDAGRIHNTLTGEVGKLFLSMNYYFDSAQGLVMLSTYIALAFLANFKFAILVAIGAAISNLIYRKIYITCKRIALEISKKGNSFNGFMVQLIHNYKYLKSTNYLSAFAVKIHNIISETEKLNKQVGWYNSISSSVKEPMIIIIVVAVIQIQLHYFSVNITSILLSLLLFYRSLGYLMTLQGSWQSFVQASAGITTVTDLINEMQHNKELQASEPYPSIKESMRVSNVTFAYGQNVVLKNVDLVIQKNKTIALVGESGSGKTTLANLISGLIKPQQGNIFIDARPLHSYNLNNYRNKIGYISQEPVVFTDNIFNNITFWAQPSKQNIARFWKIAELSSLTDFISGLPDKEQTMLGDNGMLISGGQKQRISIARELYKDTEILILDEATSALDSETERVIQDNIEKLHGTYTIIIIAHRLSTIKNADTIYLLDKGQVLECGNFEEMLNTSNRFKRMVALQEM